MTAVQGVDGWDARSSDRADWDVVEGGAAWTVTDHGVELGDGPGDWHAFRLPQEVSEHLRGPGPVLEVTVRGEGGAAGISFGPYRDLLAPLDGGPPRRLRLELFPRAGSWQFQVDGVVTRQWWDGPTHPLGDLLNGAACLKAHRPETVVFEQVRVRPLADCAISVVLTCHRFLQRLQVALRSWCAQRAPAGSFEIVVVSPGNADGTSEYLGAVAAAYPSIRIRHLVLASGIGINKGVLLNRALSACSGRWIWFTDADCVFPADAVGQVAAAIGDLDRTGDLNVLLYGERRYLDWDDTAALLAGAADAVAGFRELSAHTTGRRVERQPWGYTQILPRAALHRVAYREDYDHVAHSDGDFVRACRSAGMTVRQLPGLGCLHLEHPFAWFGTNAFC